MAEILLTPDEMLQVLKQEISKAGTMRKFAKLVGFSPEFISQVVNRRLPVSAALADYLGFEKKVVYKPRIEVTNATT